jgi:hypothetical protein
VNEFQYFPIKASSAARTEEGVSSSIRGTVSKRLIAGVGGFGVGCALGTESEVKGADGRAGGVEEVDFDLGAALCFDFFILAGVGSSLAEERESDFLFFSD